MESKRDWAIFGVGGIWAMVAFCAIMTVTNAHDTSGMWEAIVIAVMFTLIAAHNRT